MADMNKTSGQELTEEVQKGIKNAKTSEGHKYRRSPMELIDGLDHLSESLTSVEAYCEKSKVDTYSKISNFGELVAKVKDVVEKDQKLFSTNYRDKISEWLKSYDLNPTADGFAERLKQLKFDLTDGDWVNSQSYETLNLDISNALDEYNKSTGELFFFSSLDCHKEPPVVSIPNHSERDSAIFFLAQNGFNSQGESTFFKDLQGSEITVSFGPNDVEISVSGKRNGDVVVPIADLKSELSKNWLRDVNSYSKISSKTHDDLQSYSRSYGMVNSGKSSKANESNDASQTNESYTNRLKRISGYGC